MSENRRLFDRELTIAPSGNTRLAIGTPNAIAKNITLDSFKTWLGVGGGVIKTSTFALPAWNMSTTATVSVLIYKGIFTSITVDEIRGMRVIIRNDSDIVYSDLLSVQNGTAYSNPQISASPFDFFGTPMSMVYISRRAGSFYSLNYTKTADGITPYSRGWLTVDYVD